MDEMLENSENFSGLIIGKSEKSRDQYKNNIDTYKNSIFFDSNEHDICINNVEFGYTNTAKNDLADTEYVILKKFEEVDRRLLALKNKTDIITDEYASKNDLSDSEYVILKKFDLIDQNITEIKRNYYTKSEVDNIIAVNGYEYVDLGLSVKWATCNVGAIKPEEYGEYFAWGDVEGHTSNTNDGYSFNWAHAPFNNGNSSYNSTYFTKVKDTVCPNGVLLPKYDAATQNIGGKWRIPTKAEWVELYKNTTSKWAQVNGINGRKFTASNGNSIFIPASGYRYDSSRDELGSGGYYWSSSLNVNDPSGVYDMYFDNGTIDTDTSVPRYKGFCVRPVLDI